MLNLMIIHLVGLLSPGPDFFYVSRISAMSSRREAIGGVIGITIGVLIWATADDMGVHDHGSIVWDEFVGVFIVLAAIPTLSLPWIAIVFVLFRFFDILKPYPIRYFDQKLESGFGIMVDDVLAAIYAVIVIVILRIVGLPC